MSGTPAVIVQTSWICGWLSVSANEIGPLTPATQVKDLGFQFTINLLFLFTKALHKNNQLNLFTLYLFFALTCLVLQ